MWLPSLTVPDVHGQPPRVAPTLEQLFLFASLNDRAGALCLHPLQIFPKAGIRNVGALGVD